MMQKVSEGFYGVSYLIRYLEDRRLELSNNRVESAVSSPMSLAE